MSTTALNRVIVLLLVLAGFALLAVVETTSAAPEAGIVQAKPPPH